MSLAGVAHPVERHLAKVEVASSSLVTRSIKPTEETVGFLFDRKKMCISAFVSNTVNYCLSHTPVVGRGHDPADQVAHFALARFNGSAFITLRFGGVMTPPYETSL